MSIDQSILWNDLALNSKAATQTAELSQPKDTKQMDKMATFNCINQSIFILLICFRYSLSILTKLPAQFSKCRCGLSPSEQLPQVEATTQFGMVQNGGGLLKRAPGLGEPRCCRLDQILLGMLLTEAYSVSVTGHNAGVQLNTLKSLVYGVLFLISVKLKG